MNPLWTGPDFFDDGVLRAAKRSRSAAEALPKVSRGLRPGGMLAKLAATRFLRASALLHATDGF